jgi:competence protein ComEA
MHKILAFLLTGLLAFSSWASGAVNINTATAEELATALKGVGQVKAEAIVRYREANGAFTDIDELVNVKGIGLRTVDMNREFIKLEGETGPDTDTQ